MLKLAASTINRSPRLLRWTNWMFYEYLARLDAAEGAITLMNYGYLDLAPDAPAIPMQAADEDNRLCLQLYHHIASAIDLNGRDALEVGSGRGGGAVYVKRVFGPRTMTGVDYSERAVEFCQRAHSGSGAEFVRGDAEALPFEDQKFDAVINVESSHCYGSMARFLSEVYRVLRPSGHLSWADFRAPAQIEGLERTMRECGFEIAHAAALTPNVLASMARQGDRYRALIDRKVPAVARPLFYTFAGVEGSHVLRSLRDGGLVYLHRVARKGEMTSPGS